MSTKPIEEFATMEKHCLWVWYNIIGKFSKSKEIYFVANSMGGVCTLKILNSALKCKKINLIKKIVFTDSTLGTSLKNVLEHKDMPKQLRKVYRMIKNRT